MMKRDTTVAWQSAIAASFCLGLPAGLLFWLVLARRLWPSNLIENVLMVLQDYFLSELLAVALGAIGWGLALSRISGYKRWWWLVAATMAGIFLGRGPMLNGWLDRWLQQLSPVLPVHIRFGVFLTGGVLAVTVCTGLALGLVLRDWKACLALAGSSGLASVLASGIVIILMDMIGIRVGSGNAAMPKVAACGTLAAAIAGGATMGVVFCRFVREKFRVFIPEKT